MSLIRRDPFAQTELHREVEPTGGGRSCDWCGGFRWRKGVKLWSLFKFKTESDAGRSWEHKGLFCRTDCHDSFHS